MTQRTISEVSELVHSRPISPVELTRECLQKINALNSELNAFITVTAESALREAALAQDEIAAGKWRGPLHGIPVGLKDLIDTAGVRTTAASRVFADRVPVRDAEIVARLREAGAVLVGKQNLHEFAYGGSSVISAFGVPRNPIDSEYIAGGSSGGSAAAVGGGRRRGAVRTPSGPCDKASGSDRGRVVESRRPRTLTAGGSRRGTAGSRIRRPLRAAGRASWWSGGPAPPDGRAASSSWSVRGATPA